MLSSFGHILKNQSIQLNIDNSSACQILTVGISKTSLQNIVIDVLNFCSAYNIKLIPQRMPREQNELADHYSRINDTDNWTMDDGNFKLISNLCGPFTIDTFADNFNHEVEKFIFKYYFPGTSHFNAFTANWIDKENWLCPPVSDIGSVNRYLKFGKAKGILLVSVWRSAYFQPPDIC